MILSTPIFVLYLVIVSTNGDKDAEENCRKESGWTKDRSIETSNELQGLSALHKYDVLPKEFFCFSKCMARNDGFMKNDDIDIERYRESMVKSKTLKEGYLDCLKHIKPIKECEDFRAVLKCKSIYTKTPMEIDRDCMQENHWSSRESMELNNNLTKLNLSIIQEIDYIPKEDLCSIKCWHERKGIYVNGKINLDLIPLHTKMFEKTKGYIRCMEEIEIKQCEDVKKHFSCNIKFASPVLEECAKNFNFTVVRNRRYRRDSEEGDRSFLCFEKCMMEKHQLLDENGVIQWERAKYYNRISLGVRDKTALFECLKGLKILKCEDFQKIKDCKQKLQDSE